MNSAQISGLLLAAEHLSFSRAAEELYITQSAVSRQVQSAERELGIDIFLREGNTLRLTPAGEELIDGLRRLDTEYRDLVARAKALSGETSGRIRFGLMEDQMLDLRLVNTLEKISDPSRQFSFIRLPQEELISQIHSGQLDAACMLFQTEETEPGLCRRVLSTEPICLAAARRLNFGPVDTPEAMLSRCCELNIPLIKQDEGQLSRAAREMLSHVRRSDSVPLAGRPVPDKRRFEPTVSAGFAVSFTNPSSTLSADPLLEAIPLPFLPGLKKGLLWNPENSNPLLRLLLEKMEQTE